MLNKKMLVLTKVQLAAKKFFNSKTHSQKLTAMSQYLINHIK